MGYARYDGRSLAPDALGPQKSDLLSLDKRQVSPGYASRHEQWHPATMTEPSGADNLRHPDRFRSLLTGDPGRNLFPELSFDLTTKRRAPGERIAPRPVNACIHPPDHPMNISMVGVLRRPFGSALRAAVGMMNKAATFDGPPITKRLIEGIYH